MLARTKGFYQSVHCLRTSVESVYKLSTGFSGSFVPIITSYLAQREFKGKTFSRFLFCSSVLNHTGNLWYVVSLGVLLSGVMIWDVSELGV